MLWFSIRTASGENKISLNKSISSVELSAIMILAKWLRTFPDDFHAQHVIKVMEIR